MYMFIYMTLCIIIYIDTCHCICRDGLLADLVAFSSMGIMFLIGLSLLAMALKSVLVFPQVMIVILKG